MLVCRLAYLYVGLVSNRENWWCMHMGHCILLFVMYSCCSSFICVFIPSFNCLIVHLFGSFSVYLSVLSRGVGLQVARDGIIFTTF